MSKTIAELNDQFRHGDRSLGCYMMTFGVKELSIEKQFELSQMVRNFDSFTNGNDPYGEHDFGKIIMDQESYY